MMKNKLSKIFITSALLILANPALSSLAEIASYQQYINKITGSDDNLLKSSKNIWEIAYSKAMESWLTENEKILNQKITTKYKSRLVISINSSGDITGIEVLDLKEKDFNKFKNLIAEISDIKFAALPKELSVNADLKLILDTDLLFFERQAINYLSDEDQFKIGHIRPVAKVKLEQKQVFQKDQSNNINELIGKIQATENLKAKLISPDFMDYPRIGEELSFKLEDGTVMKAHISNIARTKLLLEVHQLKYEQESINTKLNFIVKNTNSKNFTRELLNSALNTALQGGILNGISSYGIVPGTLAIAGATGKALQLNDTTASFNWSKGDTIVLEKIGG